MKRGFVPHADSLIAFECAARHGSFTRAAEKLFLTQPAIRLQIQALETELQEMLLERNRRQIRLTPAGEILFLHARDIFARLEEAHSDIAALKSVLRGRLAIGTSDTNCTYILPGLLAEFRARHPEVELDIRNRMSPEVGNLVLNDEGEFGLATLPVKLTSSTRSSSMSGVMTSSMDPTTTLSIVGGSPAS